jgi:hypothetical protein
MVDGVMPRRRELLTTDARVSDDVAAQWEQILSESYVPWTVSLPEVSRPDPFRAWVRRWWIDDLALVDGECGPCSGRRTRSADPDGQFVVLLIIQSGAETVSQRHIEATLTPGDVVAWDSTQRNRFTVGESVSKRKSWQNLTERIQIGGQQPRCRGGCVELDPVAHPCPPGFRRNQRGPGGGPGVVRRPPAQRQRRRLGRDGAACSACVDRAVHRAPSARRHGHTRRHRISSLGFDPHRQSRFQRHGPNRRPGRARTQGCTRPGGVDR